MKAARNDGYMRQAMPAVSAFIDDLRAEFGRLDVDVWIKDGLAEGTFHAREGGREVGRPIAPPANAVSLRDMVIAPLADASPEDKRARSGRR